MTQQSSSLVGAVVGDGAGHLELFSLATQLQRGTDCPFYLALLSIPLAIHFAVLQVGSWEMWPEMHEM